jgi:hypothetical protein
VLAITSFGEGKHDEPPRYRGSVCSRQSREHGCCPSSPFDWKSLTRFTQPLTFSVASQAPSRGSHLSTAGHSARFAYETPAATLLVDLLGQDCACAAWFRGNTAHNPERLEPCRTPQETPRVGTPRPCVSTRPETPAHRFTRPTPRRPIKGASAPAELDQPVPRILRLERPPARDASSQLVHSTLSKTSTRAA